MSINSEYYQSKYDEVMKLHNIGLDDREIAKKVNIGRNFVYGLKKGLTIEEVKNKFHIQKVYILKYNCNFGPEVCKNCGETHITLNDNYIIRVCNKCGKTFGTLKYKPNIYCSLKCANEDKKKQMIGKVKHPNNPTIPEILLFLIIKYTYPNEEVFLDHNIIGTPFLVDCCIPRLKKIFEFDGKPWHTNGSWANKNRDIEKRDILRRKELESMGFTIIIYKDINQLKTQVPLDMWNKFIKISKMKNTFYKSSKYDSIINDFISSGKETFIFEVNNKHTCNNTAKNLNIRRKVRKLKLNIHIYNNKIIIEKGDIYADDGRSHKKSKYDKIIDSFIDSKKGLFMIITNNTNTEINCKSLMNRIIKRKLFLTAYTYKGNIYIATSDEIGKSKKSTKYIGVSKYGENRFTCSIKINDESMYLGIYNNPIIAAKAYDVVAKIIDKKTNF